MWYDMGPAQQKLLGIAGAVLVGWLLLALAVSAGLFSGSFGDPAALAILLLIALTIAALISVLLHLHSALRKS